MELTICPCLGMLLSGDTIDVQTFERTDSDNNCAFNRIMSRCNFFAGPKGGRWQLLLDTASVDGFAGAAAFSGDEVKIPERATMLLKLITGSTTRARQESWKSSNLAPLMVRTCRSNQRRNRCQPTPSSRHRRGRRLNGMRLAREKL